MTKTNTVISIQEFVEFGFLQEVNRQFFHPLGLALAVEGPHDEPAHWILKEIWDDRDDPEGDMFHDISGPVATEKAKRVQTLWDEKAQIRIARFGWVVQPIGSSDRGGK